MLFHFIFYNNNLCILCGLCIQECKTNAITSDHEGRRSIERNKCCRCGSCADVCPTGALEKAGRYVSADEVLAEVVRDRVFYEESGGGMTLSGGEPLLQYEFSLEILQQAKAEKIHTCIETCGLGKTEDLRSLATFTDIMLFDWKESDPELHRKWTGVENDIIRNNLDALERQGAEIILRCPIVPGFNLREDHLEGIAEIASTLSHCHEIHLMNYHGYGLSKYERLGMSIPSELKAITPINSGEMNDVRQMLALLWKGKIEVYWRLLSYVVD